MDSSLNGKSAEYYFKLAEEAYSKGDLNFAKIMYEKAAELDCQILPTVLKANIMTVPNIVKVTESYARMSDGLSNLNTMRGGEKGFKGFVAEEFHAGEASAAGKTTYVINNNGTADLMYIGNNGHKYYNQVKFGYKPGQIDFAKYKGQTIIVDKGNPYFNQYKAEASKYGIKVMESNVTKEETETLAKWMQKETSITGAKNATVVPKVAAAHKAGVQSATKGAQFGAGFSIGSNLVDVACGDKEVGEDAKEVAKDTAISYAAGYAVGAAGSVVAGTGVGATIIGVGSMTTTAVASTTVGGAIIGAGTVAAGTVAGVGVAATTTAVGVAGVVGSTIGGAAVAATAGTAAGSVVASGIAATAAVGAAAGVAVVAAAPVVAVGAVVGVGYKLLKKLF